MKILRRNIQRVRGVAMSMNREHDRIVDFLFPRPAAPPGIWFPDDDGESLESGGSDPDSTYPAHEVGSKVLDQYRTLNQNPVPITNSPIQLALENRSRKEMIIVNVGVLSILIAFGFSPTSTVFTMPLQACAIANDGTGGIIVDQAYKGSVWAVLSGGQAGSGSLLFTEIPE
jgi:hypothetical protein